MLHGQIQLFNRIICGLAIATLKGRGKVASAAMQSCRDADSKKLKWAILQRCQMRLPVQAQLRTDAAILEEERSSSMVLSIHTEPRREGVFDWLGGPPSAGKKATFVYNKQSSPLASAQVTCLQLHSSPLVLPKK